MAKIPYFKTLGVTAVWLTPVYVNIVDLGNSAGYHGYWAVDFERVDPHLYSARPELAAGSRAYLAELVQTFHDHDLKVVLDSAMAICSHFMSINSSTPTCASSRATWCW